MGITNRQELILDTVIGEYINTAQPVSSLLLENKYDFGICPASLRIEMYKLAEKGYLCQPHTSAGRAPTDKGYRFFVDKLLAKGFFEKNYNFKTENLIKEEIKDKVKLIQFLTKSLAEFSSNLALGYLFNEKILWKEGWEDILQEPEFKETKLISNFANLLKSFEEEISDFEINYEVRVYIGKENPFPKAKDFSIIISKCHFPDREEGILAILGPKRMTYEKNIGSLNYLTKLLEEL